MNDEKTSMNRYFSLMNQSHGSKIWLIGALMGFISAFILLMTIGLAQAKITL